MAEYIFWIFLLVVSIPALSYLRSIKAKGRAADKKSRTADDPYEAYTTEFDVVCRHEQIASLLGPMALSSAGDHERALEKFNDRRKWILANVSTFLPDSVERCRRAVVPRDLTDTAVTILIDHSGSMRGEGIIAAAAAVALMSEYLARLGVSVEVLGFTTCHWKGGKSRKSWLVAGKPAFPGRLNDLLHIIYKDHGDRLEIVDDAAYWTMLRPDILKENIDGEAILWALQRLRSFPSQHKLLILVSDGAPVDDSTILSDFPGILHANLIDVLTHNRSEADVTMLGIGLDHDFSLYYHDALTLSLPFLNGNDLLHRLEQTVVKTTMDCASA